MTRGSLAPRPRGELRPEQVPREVRSANPSVRAPPPSITSYWDRDTQAFNVGSVGRPAFTDVSAPSVMANRLRSSARAPRPLPAMRMPRMEEAAPADTAATEVPTRQSQLPTTREGFVDLAYFLRGARGMNIKVYTGSTLTNIRKNFIKRLGLTGKP